MQTVANRNPGATSLWRRYGAWGFCFFLVKGLAWLSPLLLTRLVG